MISGPVFPRTRAGLLGWLEQNTDSIERGLAIVVTDLELDDGHSVEALAVDAAGSPVFVFVADPPGDREIAARVLAARAWLSFGLPLLARARPMPAIDLQMAPRVLVIGFDFTSSVQQQLAELPKGSVEVLQVRPLRVGHEVIVGLQPLLGSTLGSETGFQVPSGITEANARAIGARFLDLLQRVDPDLLVDADRYSRRFRVGDRLIAELVWHAGALCVRVPDSADGEASTLVLVAAGDCRRAVDRVARQYLRVAGGCGADAASPATDVGPEMPAPPRARLSLDPLRRSAVESRNLSEEEYTLLGEPRRDDGRN